jgi:hypothetical protein
VYALIHVAVELLATYLWTLMAPGSAHIGDVFTHIGGGFTHAGGGFTHKGGGFTYGGVGLIHIGDGIHTQRPLGV